EKTGTCISVRTRRQQQRRCSRELHLHAATFTKKRGRHTLLCLVPRRGAASHDTAVLHWFCGVLPASPRLTVTLQAVEILAPEKPEASSRSRRREHATALELSDRRFGTTQSSSCLGRRVVSHLIISHRALKI